MEQLTSQLFGLEPKHLMNCNQMERAAYHRMLMFFMVFMLLLSLSMYYFFYMLVQSYWWAIIPTMLLSFVFFSLFRFILITIQLPLNETVTLKKLILNGSTIFRVILFSLLVFTFAVPLVAFVFRSSIAVELDLYKKELLEEFVASKKQMLDQQLQSLDTLIALKKAEQLEVLSSKNSDEIKRFKINEIKKKIDILNVEKISKSEKYNTIYALQISQYIENLKNAGMPFKRFELLFQQKASVPMLLLVFLPLFLLLPLFLHLKYSQKYAYSKLFAEEMIIRITKEYEQNKLICEQELERRFKYINQQEPNYTDPPFNRNPVKKTPTRILNQTLGNILDTSA
jgi:hypothetical protein